MVGRDCNCRVKKWLYLDAPLGLDLEEEQLIPRNELVVVLVDLVHEHRVEEGVALESGGIQTIPGDHLPEVLIKLLQLLNAIGPVINRQAYVL